MSKLSVRVYRAREEEGQYLLVGATDEISKIKDWISNPDTVKFGLFIHTGFEHLEGTSIQRFTELARNGNIVACATSWTLLSPQITNYKWGAINDSSNYSPKISSIPNEYFIGSLNGVESEYSLINSTTELAKLPASQPELDDCIDEGEFDSDVELVNYATKLPSETSDNLNNVGSDVNLTKLITEPMTSRTKDTSSSYMQRLLDFQPELIAIINECGLKDDDYLLNYEFELPLEARIELANMVFSDALEESESLFRNSKSPLERAKAVIKLAHDTPRWIMDIPIPSIPNAISLNKILRGQKIITFKDLSLWTYSNLIRIPNFKNQPLTDLYNFQSKNLMKFAEDILIATHSKIESNSHETSNLSDGNYTLYDVPPSLSQIIQSFCINLKPEYANLLRLHFQGNTAVSIANDNDLGRANVSSKIDSVVERFKNGFSNTVQLANKFKSFIDLLYLEQEASLPFTLKLIEAVNFDENFNKGESLATTKSILKNTGKIIGFKDYDFKLVTLNGTSVSLPFPSNVNIDGSVDLLIDSIVDIFDIHTPEEAMQLAKLECLSRGLPSFLSSLFANELVSNRLPLTQDGMVVKPAPKADARRAAILKIFNESERPLDWESDCLPQLLELLPEGAKDNSRGLSFIEDLRLQTLSTSDDYIYSLGKKYALWKHLAISDEEANTISEAVSGYLAKFPNKQFSDLALLKHINNEGGIDFDIKDKKSKYLISAALFRTQPSNVRDIGRNWWKYGSWTNKTDSNGRLTQSEIICDAIKENKYPMNEHSLIKVINEKCDYGVVNPQIHESGGIVRVYNSDKTSLYWSIDLDPYPLESILAQKIQNEITEILTTHSQRSLVSLKTSISQNSDLVSQYSDAEFLCLALRTPNITLDESQNGFVLQLEVKHH